MAEKDESGVNDHRIGNSKFSRIFLTLFAGALIFAGPTYIPYVLADILNVNYVISIVTGLILFIAGLLLLWFLVKKKIVTM